MPPVRTVYVPCFSSQLGSRQRDEPQPGWTMDQTGPPCQGQRAKSGNKRAVLKVKLPKFDKKVTKEDKTPRRWTSEPTANKTKTTMSRGGETQCAGSDSDSAVGDVFFFSQRPTSHALNVKEKAKLAVLRTISKVLEENQLIRQRLVALSQAN